jgi:hypothetical protein
MVRFSLRIWGGLIWMMSANKILAGPLEVLYSVGIELHIEVRVDSSGATDVKVVIGD